MSDADSEANMDVDNGSQKGFGSDIESIFVEGYDDDVMDTTTRMKILRCYYNRCSCLSCE